MERNQKIFKDSYLNNLLMEVRTGNFQQYFSEEFEVLPINEITSTVVLQGNTPELGTSSSDDFESGVAVYEFLGKLSRTQASDKRLWTYLSHVTFRNYSMKRWGIDEDMMWKDAVSRIINRWFVATENSRSFSRNAIARLWWATNLTVAPWESNSTDFAGLKFDDKYIYTRILLSNQDIFQAILERNLGRSPKLLIAFLEYLRQNPESQTRSIYRDLVMELNLILGYRKLPLLSFDQVYRIIEQSV